MSGKIGLWILFWDRTAFISGCFVRTGIKGIKWNYSICSFLSRRRLILGSLLLVSWKKAIAIKSVSKRGLMLKTKFADVRQDWYVESLLRPNRFHFRMFFQHGIKGIKWNDSIWSFVSRRKLNLGSLLLFSWKEPIPIKWVPKRTVMLKTKFADVWQDCSMESLLRATLLHFGMLSHHRNQRNKVKRFKLKFPL